MTHPKVPKELITCEAFQAYLDDHACPKNPEGGTSEVYTGGCRAKLNELLALTDLDGTLISKVYTLYINPLPLRLRDSEAEPVNKADLIEAMLKHTPEG